MIPFHQTKAARIASVIAAGTLVFGVSGCGGDDDVDEVENEIDEVENDVENEVDEVENELDEVESELDEVESELRDP